MQNGIKLRLIQNHIRINKDNIRGEKKITQ
jgi:hypothetical protein